VLTLNAGNVRSFEGRVPTHSSAVDIGGHHETEAPSWGRDNHYQLDRIFFRPQSWAGNLFECVVDDNRSGHRRLPIPQLAPPAMSKTAQDPHGTPRCFNFLYTPSFHLSLVSVFVL